MHKGRTYSDSQKAEWRNKGEELVAHIAYDLLSTFSPIEFQQLGQTVSWIEDKYPKQINDESLLFLIERKIIDYSCAKEVMEGYKNGLTMEQIDLYAKKNLDWYTMQNLRKTVEEQDLKTKAEMLRKQAGLDKNSEATKKLEEEQRMEEQKREDEKREEERRREEEKRLEEERTYDYSSRKDCLLAVMANGMNLLFVPAVLQSPEIIMLAIDNNKEALEFVIYQEDYKKALNYQITGKWEEDAEIVEAIKLEKDGGVISSDDESLEDKEENSQTKSGGKIEEQPKEAGDLEQVEQNISEEPKVAMDIEEEPSLD